MGSGGGLPYIRMRNGSLYISIAGFPAYSLGFKPTSLARDTSWGRHAGRVCVWGPHSFALICIDLLTSPHDERIRTIPHKLWDNTHGNITHYRHHIRCSLLRYVCRYHCGYVTMRHTCPKLHTILFRICWITVIGFVLYTHPIISALPSYIMEKL